MYYSFSSYVKAKDFLKDNPSGKIVSWNYASNEPVKFRVFVAKEV